MRIYYNFKKKTNGNIQQQNREEKIKYVRSPSLTKKTIRNTSAAEVFCSMLQTTDFGGFSHTLRNSQSPTTSHGRREAKKAMLDATLSQSVYLKTSK